MCTWLHSPRKNVIDSATAARATRGPGVQVTHASQPHKEVHRMLVKSGEEPANSRLSITGGSVPFQSCVKESAHQDDLCFAIHPLHPPCPGLRCMYVSLVRLI